MILDRLDVDTGQTAAETISFYPGTMRGDAIGMWMIVPDGRQGFVLSGDELSEYVRRAVETIVAHGGRPVVGGGDTDYHWILQKQYGTEPAAIVEAVVEEWVARGRPDCDVGDLWFTTPDVYNKTWRGPVVPQD